MSELSIKIRKLQDNGTTFKANPGTLELGGVGSAKVDTLRFEVPEEWKQCVISLHVKRLSGTLPDPQLLDEANCVVVDRRWTLEKQGTWMLLAVGDDGYVAMTKPGQYTCYETIDTDSTTETIEPSIYEQFVAQVKQYAEQAKASKESASEAEAGAKQAFEDTKETKASALTDIAAARQKALDDTETARTGALENIETARSGALEDIEQARTAALDDVADSTKTAVDAANAATEQASAAAGSAQEAADSEAAAKDSAEAAQDSAARAKADADKVSAMVTMDKTLSIEGAPADAKATGDEFATKADKESTEQALASRYTKTEVESLIKKMLAQQREEDYAKIRFWASNDPTSPAAIIGGTWERITGKFIMGASDDYPVGTTGGSATHTLTVDEMPSHSHSGSTGSAGGHSHSGTTTSAGAHSHSYTLYSASSGSDSTIYVRKNYESSGQSYSTSSAGSHSHSFSTNTAGAHTHTVSIGSTGGGKAADILNPYHALYVWVRVDDAA